MIRMIASSPSVPAMRELYATCENPSSLSPFLKKCAGSAEKMILSCDSNLANPCLWRTRKLAFPSVPEVFPLPRNAFHTFMASSR